MSLHFTTLSGVTDTTPLQSLPGFVPKQFPGSSPIAYKTLQGNLIAQSYITNTFEISYLNTALEQNETILLNDDENGLLLILNQSSGKFTCSNGNKYSLVNKNEYLILEYAAPAANLQLHLHSNSIVFVYLHNAYLSQVNSQLPYPFDPQQYIHPANIPIELTEIVNSFFKCRFKPPFLYYYYETRIKDLLLAVQATRDINDNSTASIPINILEAVHQVESIIAADITKHFSIPELAKQVSLNEFWLKSEFKKIYGVGPYEYLIKLRMNTAKELLLNGKSVKEVAALTGYRPSDFIVMFFKQFGITPGTLKKRNT